MSAGCGVMGTASILLSSRIGRPAFPILRAGVLKFIGREWRKTRCRAHPSCGPCQLYPRGIDAVRLIQFGKFRAA